MFQLYSRIKNKIEALRCAAQCGTYNGRDLHGMRLFRHRLFLLNLQIVGWEAFLNFLKLIILITHDSGTSFNFLFQGRGMQACRYSYRQFKLVQKKVRLFSATATTVLVVATVIASMILNMFFGGSQGVFAGTYNFTQTDWAGGADGGAPLPQHPANETNWTKYSSASQVDTTNAELKLSSSSGNVSETFTATTNKDSANTTANWNTGTGQLEFPAGGGFSGTDLTKKLAGAFGPNLTFQKSIVAGSVLYLGTASGNFYSYNMSTGAGAELTSKISSFWSTNPIYAFAHDSNSNAIYLGGANGRFAVYDIASDTATNKTAKISGFWGTELVQSLVFDSVNSTIYLGSNAGKFAVYAIASDTATDKTAKVSSFWGPNTIYSLSYISGKIYLFGYGNAAYYDVVSDTVVRINKEFVKIIGSASSFGTYSSIVHAGNYVYLGFTGGKFLKYETATGVVTDLTPKIYSFWGSLYVITALAYDSTSSSIYIAGQNGLFAVYDIASDTATNKTAKISSFWGTTAVYSMAYDSSSSTIYLGGQSGKFAVYNPATDTATDKTAKISGFMTGLIYSMAYNAGASAVYVGDTAGKFAVYDIASDTATDKTAKISGFWSGQVSSLVSASGSVYLGSSGGKFAIYDIVSDTATDKTSKITSFWSSASIYSLAYNSTASTVYLGGASGKFAVYDIASDTATNKTAKVSSFWTTANVNSMAYNSSSSAIFLGGSSGNFAIYDVASDTAANKFDDIANFLWANDTLSSSFYDSANSSFYVGSASGKFIKYVPGTDTATDKTSKISSFWVSSPIYSMTLNPSASKIYLAGGIGKFAVYDIGADTASSKISQMAVSGITPVFNSADYDSINNAVMVVGSYGKIIRYNIATDNSQLLMSALENYFSETHLTTYALAEDTANGVIYMAFNNGVFAQYNPVTDTVTDKTSKISSFWTSSNIIYSLVYDSAASTVYIGGASGKFAVYDIATDTATDKTAKISSFWGAFVIYSLAYDSTSSAVYLGGQVGKFAVYNPATDTATDKNAKISSFWGVSIFSLAYASSSSTIYLAGESGKFAVYDIATDTATDKTAKISSFWGSVIANAVVCDSTGANVYLGGNSGKFAVYNIASDTATDKTAKVSSFVSSSQVYALSFDSAEQTVYLGVNAGKFGSYNLSSDTATSYTSTLNYGSAYSIKALIIDPSNGKKYMAGSNRFMSAVIDTTAYGRSLTLDAMAENIKFATLTKNDTAGGGTITYYLSNDGGSTFAQVTPGSQYAFVTTGSDLRFKIGVTSGATVQDVSIAYGYYATSGSLISSMYDTTDQYNALSRISWNRSGTGTVRFQVRSAADSASLAAAQWCGPTACDAALGGGTSDFYTTGDGSEAINAVNSDKSNDRWFQYGFLLSSADGTSTPAIQDVTVQYNFNEPPYFETGFTTASQQSDGTVAIGYNIKDPEQTPVYDWLFYQPEGVALNTAINDTGGTGNIVLDNSANFTFPASGQIIIDNELIGYTGVNGNGSNPATLTGISRGKYFDDPQTSFQSVAATHSSSTAVFIKAVQTAGSLGSVAVTDAYAPKTATWTPKSEAHLNGNNFSNMALKLVANDGYALSVNRMRSSETVTGVALDLTNPSIQGITVNSSTGGTETGNAVYFPSGGTITSTITFSENVTGNGSLAFNSGGSCNYTVTNASTASCVYTVGAGHSIAPGSGLSVNSTTGTITDAYGNATSNPAPNGVSLLINTKKISVDTTNPQLSAVAPAAGTSFNAVTSGISYSITDNFTTDDLKSDANSKIVFTRTGGAADNGSPRTCTLNASGLTQGTHSNVSLAGASKICTADVSLVDGAVYTMEVSVVDQAGNSVSQSNINVTYDTTAPTLSENAALEVVSDATPDYAFTSSEAGSIIYSGDCSSVTGTAVSGSNTVTFNELGEGVHDNCGITVTDAAQNVSAALNVTSFRVDITNPAVVFTDDVAVGPTKDDTITISITEANPDTSKNKYVFSADIDCSAKDYTSGVSYDSGVSFHITTETNNGKYICARAVDLANRTDYQASVRTLNIDATPPAGYSVNIGQNYANIGNQGAVSFTLDGAEVGTTYDYSIDDTDGGTLPVTGSGAVSSVTQTITGIDVSSLTDGTLTLSVTLTDPAGNVGNAATDTITKDIVAPVLSLFTSSTADSDINNPATIYGTGDNINIQAVYSEPVRAGSSIQLTLNTTPANKNLDSFTLGSDGDTLTGTYTVEVGQNSSDLGIISIDSQSVTDLAGNSLVNSAVIPNGQNLSDNKEIIVDTTPPSLTGFSAPAGYYRSNQTITVSAVYNKTVKIGSTISVKVNADGGVQDLVLNNRPVGAINTLTGTYTVAAGQNTQNFQVTQIVSQDVTDIKNNPLNSTTMPGDNISSVVVDTTDPAAVFTDGVSAALVQSDDVTITVTETNPGTYKYVLSNDINCSSKNYSSGTVFSSGTAFTFTSEGDAGKYVCAQIADAAGNVIYLASADQLNIDSTPPTGTIALNRSLSSGQIVLSASDLHMAGMEMQISELPTFDGACSFSGNWVAYAENYNLAANGTLNKKACVIFRDIAGNASVTYETYAPETPQNLAATDISNTDLDPEFFGTFLSWQSPVVKGEGNMDQTEILSCTAGPSDADCNPSSSLSNIDYADPFPYYYSHNHLIVDTKYCYKLRFKDNHGNYSAYSETDCVVPGSGGVVSDTDVAIPNDAEDIAIEHIDRTSAQVSFRTEDASNGNAALATLATVTLYTDSLLANQFGVPFTDSEVNYNVNHTIDLTGLTPGDTYYLKITATDSSSVSNPNRSQILSYALGVNANLTFSTQGRLSAISEPSNPPAVLTDKKAVITFNTNQPARCTVEYGTIAGSFTEVPVSETDYNANHSIHLPGLIFSTTYYYQITCEDSGETVVSKNQYAEGASAGSALSFTTLERQLGESEIGQGEEADDTVGPVISDVDEDNITGESVTVVWKTDEKSNSLISYGTVSENYDSTAGNYTVNSGADNYVSSHSVIVKSLIPSTKYYYKAMSLDSSGNISESSENSFVTKAPSSLSSIKVVSKNLNQAIVTWKTDDETTSVVEYGLTTAYGETKKNTAKTKDHEITITGLESKKTYHFRVQGEDASDNLYSSSDYTFEPKSPPQIDDFKVVSITEHEAKVVFTTDVPTDALIAYADIENTENSGFQGKPELATKHELEIKNLLSGTVYSLKLKVRDEAGNETEESFPNFTTGKDQNPPKIDKVRTDSALAQNDKVQSIISWSTDEPATTSLIYKEGRQGEQKEVEISPAFSSSHVAVVTIFKPGTVYYFKTKSVDQAKNEAVSEEYALLTPRRKENIVQVIIANFQDIFGWVKK